MTVLCFGDSNTYGYDPREYFGGCYASPWPLLLAEKTGWNILNHGENGREIPKIPIKFPKTDLLIIMLGTNDLLQGHSVETVAKRMESFLKSIGPEISSLLLVAPPPMKLGSWVSETSLTEASKKLAQAYQALSRQLGVWFADAGEWNLSLAFDGVHLTEEGHRALAEGLYNYLMKANL